jgi:predicted Zn finger-like uncharacterized protein
MIIQCEQCETTYRFDSTQLKQGETQVRCVRCGHVFTVDSLSDLGESFLTAKTSQVQPSPEHTESEHVQESFTEPQEGMEDSVPEQPSPFAPESSEDNQFDLGAPAQEGEEDDFWTSPSEFSFETSEDEPTPSQEGAVSDTEPEHTAESDQDEFIFKPVEDDATEEQPEHEDDSASEETAQDVPAAKKEKPARRKKSSKLLLFILFIILIGAGIYAYFFIAHGATSFSEVINKAEEQINRLINPQPESTGPVISIQSGENFYINNEQLGALFVINGNVTNVSNIPQGEIAVKATLYGADGTALKSITTYCGNPISRAELRSESWESIQERMSNKLGTGLSNVSVQPGELIPFTVVFNDLPESFSEFSINEVQ